jgi:hypothetical protein
MERDEIISRAASLFASEGWPVIVQLLKDVDTTAIAEIRARPLESDFASATLAANEGLRNTLRHVSRLVLAANQGQDLDEPIVLESLPEHKDPFDA